MSKILICPDIHFASTSSILQKRGKKYSMRIENCIESINWLENLAMAENCTSIFYLGDFLDKNIINSEEASAIQDIKFCNLPHYIITGNHEISIANNEFSSVKIFNNISNFKVFDSPINLEGDSVVIHILPYLYDCPEKLSEVLEIQQGDGRKHIVLSHNSLKGIQLGKFKTVDGLDLKNIEESCDLFINGHLHNGDWVTNKILNLGILTGKNFNEDAFLYNHNIAIIDFEINSIELIENPFAFNFYKLEIISENDLQKINQLKNNAVITLKCPERLLDKASNYLKQNTHKIIESKLIPVREYIIDATAVISSQASISNDHLNKFTDFCIETLGSTEVLLQELSEVCK